MSWFNIVVIFVLCSTKCDCMDSEMSEKLNQIACYLSCEQASKSNIDVECKCDNPLKIDWSQIKQSNLSNPALLCKDETELHYKINETDVTVLSMIRSKESVWKINDIHAKKNVLSFRNLNPETIYQIQIYGLKLDDDENLLLYGPTESEEETTWSLNYTPLPVSDLFLLDMNLRNNLYFITIEWIQASDNACYYDFVWYSLHDMTDYKQYEIHEPHLSNQITIDDLQYGSNYSVAIMAKSADWKQESPKEWLHFTTPTCLLQHESLEKCPPMTPEGLDVTETFVSISDATNMPLYDVDVAWIEPDLTPLYYTLHLILLNENTNGTDPVFNITGNATSYHISNVELGIHYQVSLTSSSIVGSSKPAVIYREILPTNGSLINTYSTWTVFNIILIVFAPVFVFMLAVVFAVVACKRYKKKKRIGKISKTFQKKLQKFEQNNPHYLETVLIHYQESAILDKWEINPEQLKLQTILGHGAFGIVKRGWLTTEDYTTQVAIKMLKEYPNSDEIRQFRQEIEIMASVGSHPHIVSMLGCCTKYDQAGPYLVVEFCSRGDLQSYLRVAWEKIVNQNVSFSACDDTNVDVSSKEFSNKLYDFYGQDEDIIQPSDLLSISRQIAMGMEYLSNMHVLHRDLAARNILVCENRSVKVSDFGLSRDVYQDNVYCKTGGGKLPVKWMALESLTHQLYTTQSDVWSYGVLMWEIVTLGGNPYPGVGTEGLLNYLKEGYRMERPQNCNDELYEIMSSCWKPSPKDRPTFTELRIKFDKMLESMTPYLHLDINNCTDFGSRVFEKPYTYGNPLMNRYVKPSKCV